MREKPGHPRLVIGISGASGAIYGARLLELLRPLPVETHLVMSRSAEVTLALETDLKPADLRARADVVHGVGDLAAPISSGSFPTIGMIVAPCSVRSMAEIATGATTTLLTRAADVVLKERRRLVLMVRETPLQKAGTPQGSAVAILRAAGAGTLGAVAVLVVCQTRLMKTIRSECSATTRTMTASGSGPRPYPAPMSFAASRSVATSASGFF